MLNASTRPVFMQFYAKTFAEPLHMGEPGLLAKTLQQRIAMNQKRLNALEKISSTSGKDMFAKVETQLKKVLGESNTDMLIKSLSGDPKSAQTFLHEHEKKAQAVAKTMVEQYGESRKPLPELLGQFFKDANAKVQMLPFLPQIGPQFIQKLQAQLPQQLEISRLKVQDAQLQLAYQEKMVAQMPKLLEAFQHRVGWKPLAPVPTPPPSYAEAMATGPVSQAETLMAEPVIVKSAS